MEQSDEMPNYVDDEPEFIETQLDRIERKIRYLRRDIKHERWISLGFAFILAGFSVGVVGISIKVEALSLLNAVATIYMVVGIYLVATAKKKAIKERETDWDTFNQPHCNLIYRTVHSPRMAKPNFIEAKNVEEANNIDLNSYVFLERMSSNLGFYCFKIRERKR